MPIMSQYCVGSCLNLTKYCSNTKVILPNPGLLLRSTVASSLRPPKLTFCSQLSFERNMDAALLKMKIKEDQWRVHCNHHDHHSSDQRSLPSPLVSLIHDFYSAINSKDLQRLDLLLSDDCVFIDLIFYNPFAGKQGILNFFSQVMEAMGPHIHFVIEHVMEQDNSSAAVDWHLEWNNTNIPFASGCYVFQCEEIDGQLLIRKITGVEELPVNPGELILKLLKAASIAFGEFQDPTD